MRAQDTYEEPKIIAYPNMTVRIYSPILSDQERAARMKLVYKAAEALLKDKR